MQVYNNMIYWADVMPNLSIWRMDLSGNQRELAMEKTIDISGTKMNSQIMIHRGYVYYSEIKIDIESGQNQKIFTLSRFPLEHKEEAEVIYQREDPLLVNYTCQIDKNQMYILLDSSLETGEYERILLSCDLNNGQVKEIWEETSFYFTTTLMIKEKELHLLSTKLIEDISYQHRVYSLEEGIWEIQEEGTLPNEFSSVFLVDGSYVWRIYHDSGVMGYEIENWNHEPVFQGEAEGFITHIGKDEDGVILVVDCFLEEDNMEYIVLRVSEAGEEVLLDYTR